MEGQILITLFALASELRVRLWLYGGKMAAQIGAMTFTRLLSPQAAEPGGRKMPKFEELLARLEEIVSEMETAELPLDKLLATYEEGMRLVKVCGEKLADAEQKVEVLSKSVAAVEIKTPVAPAEGEPPAGEEPKEDIRLF
jgi:exodeoxyribonuclease VII small subunit